MSSLKTKYRGWIQGKTRIAAAWLFALGLIFISRDFPKWHGILVCFVGASLRYWASGYLRKDSRPAVGGPYAFVRNPLYLGTYLMAVGVLMAIENWTIVIISSIAFWAVYHFIILDEETKLQKLFGASYTKYCGSVPRFFPRIWPPFFPAAQATLLKINPEKSHLSYSAELAAKNKAFEAYASFAGLIALVWFSAWFWQHS